MTMGKGVQALRHWQWMLGSGASTILLAIVAVFLPEVDWAPKGGLVGWLLFLAGTAEFAFGGSRGLDRLGATAVVSGLLTAAAGLIFIVSPFAGYFPVVNLVILWLVLRGLWVLVMAISLKVREIRAWLMLTGATDILLSLVLATGLPVDVLVVTLFGPTPAIVAKFSLILATTFLVTGISQVGIALIQRR